jgi:hypothetical protein
MPIWLKGYSPRSSYNSAVILSPVSYVGFGVVSRRKHELTRLAVAMITLAGSSDGAVHQCFVSGEEGPSSPPSVTIIRFIGLTFAPGSQKKSMNEPNVPGGSYTLSRLLQDERPF